MSRMRYPGKSFRWTEPYVSACARGNHRLLSVIVPDLVLRYRVRVLPQYAESEGLSVTTPCQSGLPNERPTVRVPEWGS